ncbi:monooxygenase family protein [Candidatus Methylospira mobilis]|uniref:monooxygenase family protein n=1 Tax=Candidatus Methylospira mobilis TaxID=1808979 RepID=UPI00387E55FF
MPQAATVHLVIWHETYTATQGSYEIIYVNMPPFGSGCAGTLHTASGSRQSAEGRLCGQ